MIESCGLMEKPMRLLRYIFFVFVVAYANSARAAESPNVTAVLTQSETAVGRPVQLQIQVTGASSPKPPGEITVDGLDIRSGGVSRQYQMQNFSVSYSFTYNYIVMPLRPGTFKIPVQKVEAGGRTLQTPELSLTVVASSSQSSRSGRNNSESDNIDPSQIGFVELILAKSVAYVGEMIPVQIRVGLSTRAPIESLGSGVQIAGQGFTAQKMPEPRQTVETVNGRSYQMFIFKTAIAAARTGKIEIGPAEINPIIRVARGGQRNPSLPRDIIDDPFFNNFFNDPAFAPSIPKEIHLKSESATIEVKPLPPNAPSSFAGAVGTFSLKSDATPKKAQVGDPITVSASINGRGNFDRVTAPALDDDRGWHAYPPSDKFKQDDDVGISGVKSFEMVLSAKERKDKLPPLAFSFFDPIKETYVTLKTEEIPLRIEGGAATVVAPAIAAAPSPSGAPTAAPTADPAKREQDILYQMAERPASSESFTPLFQRKEFWAAQLLPLLALLGFIGWKIQHVRSGDREAQRLARLQREVSEVQRKLRGDGATPQEYVAAASRAVQLKTALARNVDPNAVDAEFAAAAFALDDPRRSQLRQLFQESDEMRYSGGRNGGSNNLSPEKRREIFELVENLHV